MTSQDAKNDNETYLGRVLASKDHDYPFYFDGNNFVALTDFEVRLDEIRSNGDYHIIPTFVSLRNGHIASLESQLRETKDRCISWAAKWDEEDNKVKSLSREIQEKDKEIERLKEALVACKNIALEHSEVATRVDIENVELREALIECIKTLDTSSKTFYHCATIFKKVEELLPEGESNPIGTLSDAQLHISNLLDRCRKLIGD